jgi:hypothetical protein
MKMSTQNMSAGGEGLSFTKKNTGGDPGPLPVRSNNVFTPKEREELKEIFHEVLSEYGLVKHID